MIQQRGFSLVEMLVSMTVFLIVIGISISIFLSMVQQQRRILKEQEMLNQVSFAEEYMSRALRMAVKVPLYSPCLANKGDIYQLTHCNDGPTKGCSGIKFSNGSNIYTNCQEFYIDTTDPSNPVLKENQIGYPTRTMLSDQIKIKYFKFIINGDPTKRVASASDTVQPKVTMLLDVLTAPSPLQNERIIQTTVSQRNLIK